MFNNSRKPELLRLSGVKTNRSASKQSHPALNRKVFYKVGYNWNKGGRLKELRIRHLARKFLRIWIQRTYGRVHPHQAKLHHKFVVLERIFEAWKAQWWTSRREWSLTLRAECHYRYFLQNQTFQRWRDFVVLQKEKTMKVEKAQSFDNRQQLHRTWERWEDFIQMRRVKLQNIRKAHQFYRQSTLKTTLNKWKRKHEHIQFLYVIQDEALEKQKLKIQHKVLLCWRDMSIISCHNRQTESRASNHNATRLKKKTFDQWALYSSCRSAKDKSKVIALQRYRLRLIKLHWTKWCQAMYDKWSEEVRLEAAGHLATRICQRRVVRRWTAYVKVSHKKGENIRKAQEQFNHHLLRAAFGGLIRNVQLNKSKCLNYNVAAQHYQQTILGKFWTVWLERVEEAEDKSFQTFAEKAQITYSISLSKRLFNFWREKLSELRHERTLTKQADRFYADRIVPRCFQSWFDFAHQRGAKKQDKVKAELHNRQRQFSWVFDTWWTLSEKHKEHNWAEQMAVFHEKQRRMRKAWSQWRKLSEMRIKQQEKQDISEHLYQERLLQKAMAQWQENIVKIKDRRLRERQACHQGDQCILKWAVNRWRNFVEIQRVKKERAEEMQGYYEVQLLTQSFATWKSYNIQQLSTYAQADQLHKQQMQKSLKKYLGLWREIAAESVQFRIRKQTAQNHHRHVLQIKMFSAWREATVHAVTKHHQQMAVLSVVLETTKKGVLLNSFRKWRWQTKHVQNAKLCWRKAEWHHDTTILFKVFRAWQNHHKQYHKYKVMKRQACLLLRLKLWQSSFDLWKMKLEHKRREARQTEHALWHWSLSLQAKVLFAWRCYVAVQRREREEVAQAALFYRDNLLREGISCMLTYAAQMNDLTTNLTQHTQHAAHVQRVVRRCALKWKHKALCKTKINRDVKVQQAKKKVSFFLPEFRSDSQEENDELLMKMLLTRMPRRKPRCNEELLKSPPRLVLLESAEVDTSVCSLGIAPPPHEPSPAAAPEGSTRLGFNIRAELPSWEEPGRTQVLLPPAAFMTTHPSSLISQNAGDLLLEESFCSKAPEFDQTADLTEELLGIKQDMKSYQQDKMQLRAWCKLRAVLQTWLQTSGQDHLSEKEDVCQELEELERRIAQLTSQLSKQKPTILQHVERIQCLQVIANAPHTASSK